MSMLRKQLIVSIVAIVAVGGLVVGGYALYNIYRDGAAVEVDQAMVTAIDADVQADAPVELSGQFQDGDSLHKGSGAAEVVVVDGVPVVRFVDFEVTAGPDLFVYLSPNTAGNDLGEFASLGRLKSNSGDQFYVLPDNYRDYQTIVIWCRAFSVTFATAELR
jgi:hypothetical protein